jgi:hypothetical protein
MPALLNRELGTESVGYREENKELTPGFSLGIEEYQPYLTVLKNYIYLFLRFYYLMIYGFQ